MKRKWQAALLIFGVALLIRLAMIGVWQQTGRAEEIPSDAYSYYEIAQNWAHGEGFKLEGKPTARRGPLYPAMIVVTSRGFPFPLGIRLVQAILGAVSCVILFLLGCELWGKAVGFLAAAIYSFDYSAVRQVVSVMPEVLFVFLLLGSTWLMIRSQNQNQIFLSLFAGVLAGLAVLTKEVLTFYFFLIGIWFFWGFRKKAAVVFLLGLVLATAPWVIRNRMVFGEWGLVTSNAGHVFYLGNNPLISGRIVGEEWEYNGDSGFPQNDPSLPPLFTPEADRYLLKRGLEFVQKNPGRFLELTAGKILRFWFPFYLGSPLATKVLAVLSYLPVVILGWTGIFLSARRWKELVPIWGPIIYLSLIYSVTISGIRYRYPAMPFLTLFAAFSFYELWNKRMKKSLVLAGDSRKLHS